MRVTLRDFRPHVALLEVLGKEISLPPDPDYLLTYVRGLNQYVFDLRHMTISSRATHIARNEKPA
jgi:hypothetical protein